jgi:hypothetical protein
MVMVQNRYGGQQLLYDVTDPVRPRLLCRISNTSAHLFTGDTFEYLKQVSPTETDVMLHSLGSGTESVAGKFPLNADSIAWTADQSVVAYTLAVPSDNADFPNGGVGVHLYANHQSSLLFNYPIPAIDCICRFGLPPQMLALSADGQYLVAGWPIGRGPAPLTIYRVSDRTVAKTLDPAVGGAFWDRIGHRLFLSRRPTDVEQSWTPEAGVVDLRGAAAWSFLPGLSPDGSQVAYTAYGDPTAFQPLLTYLYDMKAGSTRKIVDSLRSQALFVKDGWVWYLEEVACNPGCGAPWGPQQPSGKVFAMQLSSGSETEVTFAAGENPVADPSGVNWAVFGPGEFWPVT